MKSKQGLDMLERVRGICRPLPEVEEIIDGFGHNVMKVRGKTFVMMGRTRAFRAFRSNRPRKSSSCCCSRKATLKRLISGTTAGFPWINHPSRTGTSWPC